MPDTSVWLHYYLEKDVQAKIKKGTGSLNSMKSAWAAKASAQSPVAAGVRREVWSERCRRFLRARGRRLAGNERRRAGHNAPRSAEAEAICNRRLQPGGGQSDDSDSDVTGYDLDWDPDPDEFVGEAQGCVLPPSFEPVGPRYGPAHPSWA